MATNLCVGVGTSKNKIMASLRNVNKVRRLKKESKILPNYHLGGSNQHGADANYTKNRSDKLSSVLW